MSTRSDRFRRQVVRTFKTFFLLASSGAWVGDHHIVFPKVFPCSPTISRASLTRTCLFSATMVGFELTTFRSRGPKSYRWRHCVRMSCPLRTMREFVFLFHPRIWRCFFEGVSTKTLFIFWEIQYTILSKTSDLFLIYFLTAMKSYTVIQIIYVTVTVLVHPLKIPSSKELNEFIMWHFGRCSRLPHDESLVVIICICSSLWMHGGGIKDWSCTQSLVRATKQSPLYDCYCSKWMCTQSVSLSFVPVTGFQMQLKLYQLPASQEGVGGCPVSWPSWRWRHVWESRRRGIELFRLFSTGAFLALWFLHWPRSFSPWSFPTKTWSCSRRWSMYRSGVKGIFFSRQDWSHLCALSCSICPKSPRLC